jgi:hypothetical protein
MGYIETIRITPEQLDLCDNCNQQGLKASGHYANDSYGEAVIFFCFNCKRKLITLK